MLVFEESRPIVIAHRGASAYAPENTLAAFELAIRQQADAIELDAKLSADGAVIVIHDQTTERTTGKVGVVKEMTLAELRKLDAGSHFDSSFRNEAIPTLDEVFDAVGQQTFINVELTNYASLTDNLPEKVAALVKRFALETRVIFSSFNPIALIRIKRLLPAVPIGLLALPGGSGAWARSWPGRLLSYQYLHPEFGDVTPKLVTKAHANDHKVFVYTVNQEDDMRRSFDWDVDGIFTDDPILARNVLKEF